MFIRRLSTDFLRNSFCVFQARRFNSAYKFISNVGRVKDFREPSYPMVDKQPKWVSANDAMEESLESGSNVFVQSFAATPTPLLEALGSTVIQKDLKDIVLHHLIVKGTPFWTQPPFSDRIRSNNYFVGKNMRASVEEGVADMVPIFLQEIPRVFLRNFVKLDLALIQVSPPDSKGFCSLGTSVDVSRSAIMNARKIIALANPKMPRSLGDGIVHSSHIDLMVYNDVQLHERIPPQISNEQKRIARLIAENLVEDGATIQVGIGAIPSATCRELHGHKDLGVHSELFSDEVHQLVESGAITNANKLIHPGKIVGSWILGSRKLYEFLDDNPMIFMGDVTWVNDTSIIKQNPKVTAINSAIEIDLTGQVASDSVGTRIISGIGGQIDFTRGAALSNDGQGRPIISLSSLNKTGESKIVPELREGAGVVTTRAHVHYVVTEFGIAHLFGKSMAQRAYELIRIAHPDHQQTLEKAAFDRLRRMPARL